MEYRLDAIEYQRQSKRLTHLALTDAPLPWQVYFGYMHTPRGYGNPMPHTQDYYEIIVYLQSGRRFFAGESLFTAEYGDIILFPPDVPHKGMDIKSAPYERYYFYIHPALFDRLPDGDALKLAFASKGLHLVHPSTAVREELLRRLSACKENQTLDGVQRTSLRGALLLLLSEIATASHAERKKEEMPPLLTSVLQYINAAYKEPLTVGSIASRFKVSESYLCRLFREQLQISPYRYLQGIRLQAARRLLIAGKSVTEACFATGFTDCSRFISYFKREFGVTPSRIK